MYLTEKEFELEKTIDSKIIYANGNHLHAEKRKLSTTKSDNTSTCTSSNEPNCKPFQTILTTNQEHIITKTFDPGKKTRTIDTKVLN